MAELGLIAFLVLAGGWIALGQLTVPPLVGWAALAATAFAVAGVADLKSRNQLPLFAGVLVGCAAAMVVGGAAVGLGLAACATLISRRALERRALSARLLSALLAGMPLFYGAVAAGRPARGVLPWILGGWLALVRELTADIEVQSRALAVSRRSPVVVATAALSLCLVPVSLVWPARESYHGAYFLVALFADLALVAMATRLLVGRLEGLGRLAQTALALGLVALVAGRVS